METQCKKYFDTVDDMAAANLKQDEFEVELRSPDRRRKLAVVDKNGLTSLEIQEYKEVFEVLRERCRKYF